MKRFIILFLNLGLFLSISSQNLKPYILGVESSESVDQIKSKTISSLKSNNLQVIGQYQPANDVNRYVIVITSNDLQNAVKKVGGLTGFAAALRIGITREGNKTIVTYTNPIYWGNAYFRKDYPKVSANYNNLTEHLKKAMMEIGTFSGQAFGSEKGISAQDLQEYHYMMGMPYFDDTEELEDFDSHQLAVNKIESSINKGVPNVKNIYKVALPDQELVLYGFALSGEDGESNFMPIIDIGKPKHTAFLPYEVLIMGNEVHMLHGRFRIALSFPDLTMGTFSKIMSTPGDIEDLLEQLVE